MKYLTMLLGWGLLLGACSTSDEDRKEEAKEVVDAVHKPIDQAKQIEKQIFDNDLERRRQLDEL